MQDIILPLITGIDIPVPECKLILHQPTIKEISYIGETEFHQALGTLCINKPRDMEGSNFQYFMAIMHDKSAREIRNYVEDLLKIFFPKYKVMLTPRALLFNFENDNSIIDENNFSSFQQVLRLVGCLTKSEINSFNPANDAAAEIARKLERGRQRVAAQKQAENNNSSIFSQYLSILSVALHTPINELADLTVFQINDLIERYSLWVHWELDVRQQLAGGKPDKETENWMKVIH